MIVPPKLAPELARVSADAGGNYVVGSSALFLDHKSVIM